MSQPEQQGLSPEVLQAARQTATNNNPPEVDRLANIPFEYMSPYAQSQVFCTPVAWQAELVEAASRVEPPNVSLIAAIGGAAAKVAFEAGYGLDELQYSGERPYPGSFSFTRERDKRSKITELQVTKQIHEELRELAVTKLQQIADRQ